MFTYASLFAGIGGFETGLNEVGGVNVFASEIDKFACQSYEALYGDKPFGDITKVKSEDIPKHDLLVAGFPCQAFSVAGSRAGMDYECTNESCKKRQTIEFQQYADRDFFCEECGGVIEAVDGRGLLFFEVARVARDKKPKAIILENVKGLVGHDGGRTLDTIVRTLSEIGYVVDFEVLNSKFFGVPHNRERVFIVAVREGLVEKEEWLSDNVKRNDVVSKGKRRIKTYEGVKMFNFDYPTQDTENFKTLKDILTTDVEERFYVKDNLLAEEITSNYDGSSDVRKDNSIKVVGNIGRTGHGNMNVHSENGISPTLTARDYRGAKLILEESSNKVRKLTPKEYWRLQGFSDEQHDAVAAEGVSNSQRYKQAGNAVTVNVIKALGEKIVKYL